MDINLFMKENLLSICVTLKYYFLASLFLLPSLVWAAEDDNKVSLSYKLDSPLAFSSIEGFFLALLRVFITIAIPIIVIAIIYAGFLYVTARGNAEQTKKATTALSYAIIGAIILIGAVAIGEIIGNLVGAFRS